MSYFKCNILKYLKKSDIAIKTLKNNSNDQGSGILWHQLFVCLRTFRKFELKRDE